MKGYHCEGCGRKRDDAEPMRRASGCQIWLCADCRRTTLALGTDVAEQVRRDRERMGRPKEEAR